MRAPSILRAGRWLAAALALAAGQGLAGAADEPFSLWAADWDSGLMWRVSRNTELHYLVAPQVISLRTPAHLRFELGEGTLVVRGRFSLLAEGIFEGPESFYLGAAASPSIEYWLADRCTHFFFSIGGGVGWTDSRGVAGGQGQDFTLNWFMHGGVRHRLPGGLTLGVGVYFQHLSNSGATDPNPGLDTLGPMIGVGWAF